MNADFLGYRISKSIPYIGYAEVGTYGLAHSLLAWARCRLWCDKHGVPMLAPNWLHVRGHIGPFLRNEYDKRLYHRLFQFSDYVTGFRRLRVLAITPRIAAETANINALPVLKGPLLVVFKNCLTKNEETHFSEIIGHSDFVLKALTSMTKPEYRPVPNAKPYIAVHVRMGDFITSVSQDGLRNGLRNSRIPIQWYVNMVTGLQHKFGDVPVRIYSDGTDEELAPLLRLPVTVRSPKQPSITDLLDMAQARLLVSSGSGFSAWGAFLGNSPRICYPGQRFLRVLHRENDTQPDLEPECESWEDIPPLTVQAILARLT